MILSLLQEIDGGVRVAEHRKRGDVMIAAAEVPTMVTTMPTQARSQSRSRTAYVHLIERRRTDAVDAPKEGLRGGRIIEVKTRSHGEQMGTDKTGVFY